MTRVDNAGPVPVDQQPSCRVCHGELMIAQSGLYFCPACELYQAGRT